MKGKLHRRPRQQTDLMLAISVLVDDCRALPTEPLAPVCYGGEVEQVSARKKRHKLRWGTKNRGVRTVASLLRYAASISARYAEMICSASVFASFMRSTRAVTWRAHTDTLGGKDW